MPFKAQPFLCSWHKSHGIRHGYFEQPSASSLSIIHPEDIEDGPARIAEHGAGGNTTGIIKFTSWAMK